MYVMCLKHLSLSLSLMYQMLPWPLHVWYSIGIERDFDGYERVGFINERVDMIEDIYGATRSYEGDLVAKQDPSYSWLAYAMVTTCTILGLDCLCFA